MDGSRRFNVSAPVFFVSAAFILAFVGFGAAFTETARATFAAVQQAIVTGAGWFYVLVVSFFLFFVFGLLISPYGALRLGKEDEAPAYSYGTWFAMLFSAGIGISLLFYSVAEPILHFTDPPVGEGGTEIAAREAMAYTFLHWGLHGWAIYVIVGLSLAFFAFRHGLPLTIRSALYPLLGRRIYGPIGHAADVFAVLGTMFGVATSLGLGVMQLNAGMHYLFGIPEARWIQVLLIAGITGVATTSVALGLTRGIRRLSIFNMTLAVALLLFMLLAGPTRFLLEALVENTGYYLSTLLRRGFETNAFGTMDAGWMAEWTLFYWGWWIAWSPFVGMFIARISRGRTVREFITGVLLAGSGFTFLWLTVFGDAALYAEMNGIGRVAETVETVLPAAFFALMDVLPLPLLSSVAALVLMTTLFVTSSDSGSLVIDIITSGGDPDPPLPQRIFWAVLEGAVAGVLLVAGGLNALQTASLASALPFSIVLLFICYGLYKGLRRDWKRQQEGRPPKRGSDGRVQKDPEALPGRERLTKE